MPITKADIGKPLYTRRRSTIDTGKGLTEQAHAKECDMNYILREYQRTGLIRHAKDNQGKYDDITVQDFQEAMFITTEAKRMFTELPADIRKRFNQDPAQFLNFVQNPANQQEMQKMGILKGNDGIDISGAPTGAPVTPPVTQTQTPPPAEAPPAEAPPA